MLMGFSSGVMNCSVLEALCDVLEGTYDHDSAYEEVHPHTALARQGEVTRYVFFLRGGVLGWRAQDRQGRSALLRSRPAPAVVGLAEALVGKGQLGDLVSLTACRLVRIPFDELRGLVLEGGDLDRLLLQQLAAELRACMKRIHDLMLLDSRERLLQVLHREAADGVPATRGGKRVAMPLKQCQTAEWLGVGPGISVTYRRGLSENRGFVVTKGGSCCLTEDALQPRHNAVPTGPTTNFPALAMLEK
jgi:CRP-like cAMP-binding protein